MTVLSTRPARIVLVIAVILATGAPIAHADEIFRDAPAPAPTTDGPRNAATLAVAGLLAGATGFTAGALMGFNIGDGSGDGVLDGLENSVAVGSLLGGLTLPIGVHLANRSAGDGGKVVLTSVGVGVAGWSLALATETWELVPLTAVVQLFACVAVEQSTTPRAAPIQVSAGMIDRAPALVIGGRF